MKIISLASGSKGNAYLVGSAGEWLLIDDGLSWRDFKSRLDKVDREFDCGEICGVLITHSHTDHVAGLGPLLSKHALTVYANAMTAESMMAQGVVDEEAIVCFENGCDFEVGSFVVHPFSIPHDTADPVGYLVRGDETYFHGTDIGTPLESIGLKFAEADVATLESNHDAVMLRNSNRPPSLIQRIAGPRGHLSNDQTCDLVSRYISPKLKRLALAHLSSDCNEPHVAENAMLATLQRIHRADVRLQILTQICPVVF